MPDIQAQTADGVIHSFPDGTPPDVMDKAIKNYMATSRDTRNSTETDFEKTNKMGGTGRQLTSLATGIMSGASGLPETENPVSDAVKSVSQPRSLKDILLDPENFSPGAGIASNLFHAGKEFFSGPPNEDPEAAAERRAHAAGSMVGQTAGFVGGDVADEAPMGRLARDVKAGTGRMVRTSDNKLKPLVKGAAGVAGAGAGMVGGGHYGAGIEGAAAGGYLGTRIADAVLPNHPDAEFQGQFDKMEDNPNAKINAEKALSGQKDLISEGPNYNTTKQRLAEQIKAKKDAESADVESRKPFPLNQSPNAKINRKKLADQVRAENSTNPILNPDVAADPFNEARRNTGGVIKSPEEWAARDQLIKILGNEAKDTGMYHAARGSTKARPQLQEKIRRTFEK